MGVTLLLREPAAGRVGASTLTLPVPAEGTLLALLAELTARYPRLGSLDDLVMKYEPFINDAHVEPGAVARAPVRDGDTVLLLSAVSGG
jgi:molybdopterin converting factor small subunit